MRSDVKLINTDTDTFVSKMIYAYEKIVGVSVQPASPERLFILWVSDALVQLRTEVNYAANQNLPSRADGANLDALGELFYSSKRPAATPATCTMQVNISEAQDTAILIPAGTRFTDGSSKLFWDCVADVYIPAGKTSTEITLICETAGIAGNGYVAGQINTLVDISDVMYYSSCANTSVSDGGAEAATDEEFYTLMRASEDAYSVAGPMGAYEYWAKSVSTEIVDVKAIRPKEAISKTANLYDGHAFLGGEHLEESTLTVRSAGVQLAKGTDYTAEYADNLLTISAVPGGALDGQTTVDMTITAEKAGHVHIFALMDNGEIATATIKKLILDACSDSTVRPLTDYVQVMDPGTVEYNVDLTYYIQKGLDASAAEIEDAASAAVDAYVQWQSAKMGRDINPSKLIAMLMTAGVKRVDVTEPAFMPVSDGNDGTVPQVAKIGTVTIRNGGYEDE